MPLTNFANFLALPAAAFAGAILALIFVLAVARTAGGGPVTLVLAGVVSGSFASAILMVLLACASARTLQSVTWWMMGSLQTAEPASLAVAGACIAAAALVILSQARALNALALGPDLAPTLGAVVDKAEDQINEAVTGGLFLVACDQLGKLFGEVEIPAGVVTALAGGPFFLWLLARRGRHA